VDDTLLPLVELDGVIPVCLDDHVRRVDRVEFVDQGVASEGNVDDGPSAGPTPPTRGQTRVDG
jgi:hypothetical protein